MSAETDAEAIHYKLAKKVFEKEEGRSPNMNDVKDMIVVSAIQAGISHADRGEYKFTKETA
jgi:hypothetical protein